MSSSSPSLSASPSPSVCSPLSLSRSTSTLSTSSGPASIQMIQPAAAVLPGAADSALLSALAAIQMHSTQLAQIQAHISSSPPAISSSAPPSSLKIRRPPRSRSSAAAAAMHKPISASASPPTAQQASNKNGSDDSGASGSESDYDANSNNNNYSVNHHQQSGRQLPSLPRKSSMPVQGSTFIGRVAADLLLLPWNKLLAALLCTFFIWLSFTRIADFQTRVERLTVENMELRNYASSMIAKESKRIEKHLASLELRMIDKLQKEVGSLLSRVEAIANRGHEMDKRIAAHELRSNLMQHAISSRLGEGPPGTATSIVQATARTTADVRHQIVDSDTDDEIVAGGAGRRTGGKNSNGGGRRELPSGIPDAIPVPPHASATTTIRARVSVPPAAAGVGDSESDADIEAATLSGMDATYSASLAKHLRDATRVVIEEERAKLQASLRAQAMKRSGLSVGDDEEQAKERDIDAEDLAYHQAEERLRQMSEKTEL